jgi:hypothetical protein
MRYIFFLLLLTVFAACNNAANDADDSAIDSSAAQPQTDSAANYVHRFTDTALEQKITAALLKLPFVIKSNNYIDSISNRQQQMAFMLEHPAAGETEIAVQAGYNGRERFETYYRFFVNPKTLEIKVYDPVADKKLSIQEYLKSQQ